MPMFEDEELPGMERWDPPRNPLRQDASVGRGAAALAAFLSRSPRPAGAVYAVFALVSERGMRYVCSSCGAFDSIPFPAVIGSPPPEGVLLPAGAPSPTAPPENSSFRVVSTPGALSGWIPGMPDSGQAIWHPLNADDNPDGLILLWWPSAAAPHDAIGQQFCDTFEVAEPLFRLWQDDQRHRMQYHRLEALEELSLAVAGTVNLTDALLKTRDALVGLGFQQAAIYVLDEEKRGLRGTWGTRTDGSRDDISSRWIPLTENGDPVAKVARGELEYYSAEVESEGSDAAGLNIVAPLRAAGQVLGAIAVTVAPESAARREEHLHVLFPFAAHAGVAVQHALMHDRLAEHLRQAEEMEARRKRFEREVILSVTDGKLYLSEFAEIEDRLGAGLFCFRLSSPACVGACRKSSYRVAEQAGLSVSRRSEFELCLGEAATNCLQHAGGGIVQIYSCEDRIQVRVSDHGPGIESFLLPRATLLKGYSTTTSLGMGFTLMLRLCDRLYLATSEKGTDLLLEVGIEPRSETERVWDQLGLGAETAA